jgi:hypothetical protein
MPAALVGAIAIALALQGTAPLKKSDLIRLLSTTALAPAEIADLVQRRCVSFTPSSRDKADLRALGADAALLRRLDECARRIAPLRASARLAQTVVPAGGRASITVELRRGDEPAAAVRVLLRGSSRLSGGPDAEVITDAQGRALFEIGVGKAAGTYRLTVADPEGTAIAGAAVLDLTVRLAPAEPTPARTGFVAGTGQRGRVGTRLPLPLVFEARDTANRPVVGRPVTLVAVNARVEGAAPATDSTGQVRAFVVLGDRAGAAHVAATLGRIERQAPLVAVAGPPAHVVLRCGMADVTAPLAFTAAAAYDVTVIVRDAKGNEVPVTDLHATPREDRVVRVVPSTGAADRFTLRGERIGTTSVAVQASGLRAVLQVAVGPAVSDAAPCRRSAQGG